jgi:membrane protease YdiL (CAAX protease family)
MRAYLWFLGTISLTLVLAAIVTYPVYALLHPHFPTLWFDRIGSRVWEFALLPAGLVFVVRHLRLTTKGDYGYGAPRPRWLRQFWAGLGAGLVSMLPVTISMLALGVRVLAPDLTAAHVAGAIAAGLGSGLAVGFIEETFFRGLLQGAVLRELRRPLLAIFLVALLFAALHFLGRVRIAHEAVTAMSGFTLLGAALANFASPGLILDAFLSLAAVGVLLGLVTWWTGSIAFAVGLHAGWVWMMRATVGVTREAAAAPLEWLVSRSDGYTGWLVLGWTAVLLAVLALARDRLRSWRRTS